MKKLFRFGREAFALTKRLFLIGRLGRPPQGYVLLLLLSILQQALWAQEGNLQELRGRVLSAIDDSPLAGATIKVQSQRISAVADDAGYFTLYGVPAAGKLIVSRTGFETAEQSFFLQNAAELTIRLQLVDNSLDDVQVIGYGNVSKRLNTGSVVTVKAADIAKQPVTNPLATLAGQVPGMTVTQSNGNAGSGFAIQIRGQNSIAQGSAPLILVDGVPFPNNQLASGMTALANRGQSPLNNINPLDIESIEVLKDADATAIYGSRGANGVVLITTKKGQQGAIKADAQVYQGFGQVTRRMELLNTEQYLEMRREAFANDGIVPTAINAPDLMLWDNERYTDWQDYLIGGTAQFTNANVSLSGGNEHTQFLLSSNYHRQGAVYPGNYFNSRITGMMNIAHQSSDKRFSVQLTGNYSLDNNALPGSDLTSDIILSPNYPALLDDQGNLLWQAHGSTFTNPLTYLKRKTTGVTDNLLANINMQYRPFKGFTARLTGGYNLIHFDQINTAPRASLDPNGNNNAYARYSNSAKKSWIIEPQLAYSLAHGKGKLELLLGGTIQRDIDNMQLIEATGFSSDALIEALAFANTITGQSGQVDYRYQALFSRINYNYADRYLVNITGRRDGSSRFGDDKRMANFGALGLAWIFSEEALLKDHLSWLSFGKLRASYGVTGNDQIGDYQYLDNYNAVSTPYQGEIGYIPSRLFNGDYSWERNIKRELGLELGFLNNSIQLTTNWFQNRSDSQLVNYTLPSQVGFNSVLRNYGALVENRGWEFVLAFAPKFKTAFTWHPSVNLTLARNRLLDFPNLASSSYANTLVIGQPLNIRRLFAFRGVDPATGLYTFDGTNFPADLTELADLTPRYFGGINNDFSYKNWQWSFLLQVVKQDAYNYFESIGARRAPGTMRNQPAEVLNRWQQAGDISDFQRFTTTGTAMTAYNNYVTYSNAMISDASFLRLKNLYVAYSFPERLAKTVGCKLLKLYFQGQNLWTLTNYKGLDPETLGSVTLPPLAVYTVGIQLNL
ncbi:SusC/RagA family TonB-linked outer membrane protein [Sphingobacterium oryzagri]|uniref:SusC/RagA family TonB-linked outer membrane protein n=1 Tax=Sphingobacterium oryzagri TaxID=3025669 RepID=A0ABY7WE77_9SPHI|nr:SusC/RagA family TonB-linked outer membrane protein [Sphingobacterium sp. KACC 22765]WDF67185.1 SusC/RagA family TonB-linked outer membrane protein [Sphingobacterium sp. KACC 22765]